MLHAKQFKERATDETVFLIESYTTSAFKCWPPDMYITWMFLGL